MKVVHVVQAYRTQELSAELKVTHACKLRRQLSMYGWILQSFMAYATFTRVSNMFDMREKVA